MVRTPRTKAIRPRPTRLERNGHYERPPEDNEERPAALFNFLEQTEANLTLSKEFVCFMAKRKNKSDSHEINYGRASDDMKKKLIRAGPKNGPTG